MMTTIFDENTIAAILALSEDDLADRFVETRRRMRDSLPTKCVDDVLEWSRGRATTYGVVLGEAAVFSLGQIARPMCNRLDALNSEHNALASLADDYNRLAAGAATNNLVVRQLASRWLAQRDLFRTAADLTFARALGLRSVLHVQLNRESYERDGIHVPVEWRLPVTVNVDGGSPPPPPPLELVPVDPDPVPPGGGGGAQPGASADTDQPSLDSGTERRDRDRDGLGFLFT